MADGIAIEISHSGPGIIDINPDHACGWIYNKITAITVLVDPVIGDICRSGVNSRVVIVAVNRNVKAVFVDIDEVVAIAILVNPIVRDLCCSGVNGRVVIVAVIRSVKTIFVDIAKVAAITVLIDPVVGDL